MSRIIEDVLGFVRTTEIKKKSAFVMIILKLAMNHVKFYYGIVVNLPKNYFIINCDARKIKDMLSNLINNVVQALWMEMMLS